MLAIFKREFSSYFKTYIGYIFITVFMIIFAIFFIGLFSNGVAIGSSEARVEKLLDPMAVIITFIIPILTMRVFAEEKKQGTESLLMTSPRSIFDIVIGKFLAISAIVLITIILTLIYPIITLFFTKANFTYNTVITTYTGFILLSLCYVSIGMVFSAITENQIIAYIISLVAVIALWFLPGIKEFGPINRYESFMQGTMAPKDIIFFITFTITALAINLILLENRKWNK